MSQQQVRLPIRSPNMPGRASEDLTDILLASLEALAATGEIEAACRFAGRACVTLRHDDPQAEQRFNVLLHRLTPRLSW